MNDSILNHLPTADGDDHDRRTCVYVTCGAATVRGVPLLVNGQTILTIVEPTHAGAFAGLLNQLANFLCHGQQIEQGRGFAIGSDSAFDLEQALRAVGVTLAPPA